jgi:hypothetical protein
MMAKETQKTRKPTTGGVIIGSSYDVARTRKMNADAEISELELERIRGTLCLTDDVVTAWETVLQAVKAKFLSIPTKLAPVVANESDVAVVKEHLEQQIREALTEMANYQPKVDPTKTAASVDSEPEEKEAPKRKVGRPRKTQAMKK